jgi:hypothetical protein
MNPSLKNSRFSRFLWVLAGLLSALGVIALSRAHYDRSTVLRVAPVLVGGALTGVLAFDAVPAVKSTRRFFIQALLSVVATTMYLPVSWLIRVLLPLACIFVWWFGGFDSAWAKVVLSLAPACIGLAAFLMYIG